MALSSGASAANPTLILALIGVARERGLDDVEALMGVLDRRAGHYAQKFVTADPDDQVIRAQMSADRVYRALEQRVAGSVTVRVVDGPQADDIHVGNHERRHRSAGPFDLLIDVLDAGGACARPG